MGRKPRQIERTEITADDLTGIVACMARLAHAGEGWINLIPKVTDDDERPTSLRFFTLFGGGVGSITMCTWIPGIHERRGSNYSTLGISHLTGRRVAAQLLTAAVAVPGSWFVEQDHPRRGLVLRVPFEESHEHVLAWALRATTALRPPWPTRTWRAEIYLPAQL